jgi:hypothetical protein
MTIIVVSVYVKRIDNIGMSRAWVSFPIFCGWSWSLHRILVEAGVRTENVFFRDSLTAVGGLFFIIFILTTIPALFINVKCMIAPQDYAITKRIDYTGKVIACIIGAIAILFVAFVIINEMT